MRRIPWIITIPGTIVVVVLRDRHRTPITVNSGRCPWFAQLPLYLVVLGSLLADSWSARDRLAVGRTRRQEAGSPRAAARTDGGAEPAPASAAAPAAAAIDSAIAPARAARPARLRSILLRHPGEGRIHGHPHAGG